MQKDLPNKRAIVIGASMGGLLAARALADPARARSTTGPIFRLERHKLEFGRHLSREEAWSSLHPQGRSEHPARDVEHRSP